MIVSYRFSSPVGDIPVGPHELSRAFKIDPERAHPFLTLGRIGGSDGRGVLEEFESIAIPPVHVPVELDLGFGVAVLVEERIVDLQVVCG